MGEGDSSSSSSALSGLWNRSKDKFRPNKVGLRPDSANATLVHEDKSSPEAALAAKQHRRAQVRKAQIEHRQRKADKTKQLEQDAIDLREMIAAAESEAARVQQENEAIKNALSNLNLPLTTSNTLTQRLPTSEGHQPSHFEEGLYQNISSQQEQWPSTTAFDALVSIDFDQILDETCLQISDPSFSDPSLGFLSSPDVFHTRLQALGPSASPRTQVLDSKNKELPPLPRAQSEAKIELPEDISTMAINFILSLEHPCRTHFHPHSTAFDPERAASNHELLASTLLFSSAPDHIFTSSSKAASTSPTQSPLTWTAPAPSLDTLKKMSESLPKDDWEICPVQAWFLLVERMGVRRLTEKRGSVMIMDSLKRGLGGIVKCFAFGAVMEEGRFWEVVGEVVGEEEARRFRRGVGMKEYD